MTRICLGLHQINNEPNFPPRMKHASLIKHIRNHVHPKCVYFHMPHKMARLTAAEDGAEQYD